jgi:hypothetical protein
VLLIAIFCSFIRKLHQFQIKDEIKAARIEATKTLTRPLATLSQRERVTGYSLPLGER